MNLGQLDICLTVKDLPRSLDFYTRLGFQIADGDNRSGFAVLRHGTTRIGLYQHEAPNMLNFRGADIAKLARALQTNGLKNLPEPELETDGSLGLTLRDPDGNVIYFNTIDGYDPAP